MCGIVGFTGVGTQLDLTRMTDMLALRGPDGYGYYVDTPAAVYLGHRRLSIIDIAGGGQPMSHSDGVLHVVFNGEIYNHESLREELIALGHVFVTDHSDTEVLLHGFKEWGIELPRRLNGMFAFAIFDARNQTIFIARDRFGEKPVFYTVTPSGIIFASELKALMQHPSCPRQVSKRGMKKLFAFGFIPAPGCIIDGVQKLLPGHHLVYEIQSQKLTTTCYWKFNLTTTDSLTISDEAASIELKRLINQAVERRLMSDVPVGVFLSGGVDSSIILSAVTRVKPANLVDTFSIGFKESSFDESFFAREVADYFGTRHHERLIDSKECLDTLNTVLDQMDEPLGDPSILPTYLLSVFARENVKVALSGDGADELFAGYDPFKALAPAATYKYLMPNRIHSAVVKAVGKLAISDRNMSLDFRLKRTLRALSYDSELWNPIWLGPLDPDGLEGLFGESSAIRDIYSDAINIWEESSDSTLTEQTLAFYTRLYLPNNILTKVDRASMLTSLEARAPFLDNDLVGYVQTLPEKFKLNGQKTKYILKQAFKNDLPKSVTSRPKKGFGIPLSAWLRDWNDPSFIDNLPYIDRDWLRERWLEHQNRIADHRQLLWCAISLSRFIATAFELKGNGR